MKIYTLGNIPESLYPSIGGKASGLDELIKKGYGMNEVAQKLKAIYDEL